MPVRSVLAAHLAAAQLGQLTRLPGAVLFRNTPYTQYTGNSCAKLLSCSRPLRGSHGQLSPNTLPGPLSLRLTSRAPIVGSSPSCPCHTGRHAFSNVKRLHRRHCTALLRASRVLGGQVPFDATASPGKAVCLLSPPPRGTALHIQCVLVLRCLRHLCDLYQGSLCGQCDKHCRRLHGEDATASLGSCSSCRSFPTRPKRATAARRCCRRRPDTLRTPATHRPRRCRDTARILGAPVDAPRTVLKTLPHFCGAAHLTA